MMADVSGREEKGLGGCVGEGFAFGIVGRGVVVEEEEGEKEE
jgi:hypothetical protein